MRQEIDPTLIKAAFEKILIDTGMSPEEATKIFYEYLITIIEAGKRLEESETTIELPKIN